MLRVAVCLISMRTVQSTERWSKYNRERTKASSGGLKRRRLRWFALVWACACASVSLYATDASDLSLLPLCPVHALTGLYCPGCGSTRAFQHLLYGNIGSALRLNPLILLVLPILAYSFASFTLETFRGRPLPKPAAGRFFTTLLIAVVMAFTILRNIPGRPSALLAPHDGC